MVVNGVEVAACQPGRVASVPLSPLGDGQRASGADELNIQTSQGVHPDRQQVRGQEHLVDDQIVPAVGECGGRSACGVQHAPADVAVADNHDRGSVGVAAGAVIPGTRRWPGHR